MGATPKFGLRYPEATDPADVPTDLHELATDVETAFGGSRYRGRLTPAQFGALTGLQDGDVVDLIADAAAGVIWRLRYNASGGTYKWEFVGGPALFSEVAAEAQLPGAAYGDAGGVGPTVTTPLAGDYDVEIGAKVFNNASASNFMSYAIGATAAVDADGLNLGTNAGGINTGSRLRRKTGLGAVALTAKYRNSAGVALMEHRWMRVEPVRVG